MLLLPLNIEQYQVSMNHFYKRLSAWPFNWENKPNCRKTRQQHVWSLYISLSANYQPPRLSHLTWWGRWGDKRLGHNMTPIIQHNYLHLHSHYLIGFLIHRTETYYACLCFYIPVLTSVSTNVLYMHGSKFYLIFWASNLSASSLNKYEFWQWLLIFLHLNSLTCVLPKYWLRRD